MENITNIKRIIINTILAVGLLAIGFMAGGIYHLKVNMPVSFTVATADEANREDAEMAQLTAAAAPTVAIKPPHKPMVR